MLCTLEQKDFLPFINNWTIVAIKNGAISSQKKGGKHSNLISNKHLDNLIYVQMINI